MLQFIVLSADEAYSPPIAAYGYLFRLKLHSVNKSVKVASEVFGAVRLMAALIDAW
jgi:hypothetical protein